MDSKAQLYFLHMVKALADEKRFKMLLMMVKQERTVTEMAQLTDLSEPTVSHHVSKLHTAGFLKLRMAGNQRFYSFNPRQLESFKNFLELIEKHDEEPQPIKSDDAWIDLLDWSTDDKKVLYDYTMSGKLTQMPTKEKKWLVVLRWIATKFEVGVRYSEQQVNNIIKEIHPDYATIRRNLVEYGFMRRERGGGSYWLTPEDEPMM